MLILAAVVLVVWSWAAGRAVYRHLRGLPPLRPSPPTFQSTKYPRDPRSPAWQGYPLRIVKHVDPCSRPTKKRES